jgi:hypothetical protein
MAAPNIVNVTTIVGKTAVANVTTVSSNVVVNTAASGKVFKINSIIVANRDGTTAGDITASLLRSSIEYKLAHTITVPADTTLVVLSKDTAVYLEEGDAIRLNASANNILHGICSYEEIS